MADKKEVVALSLSRLTAALEESWTELQAQHRDLPDVVLLIAPAGKSGKLGHFAHHRWAAGDDLRHEIAVSAEYLDRGPLDLLNTLLHEGAHALAQVRKVKDTSTHGMYHNKRFAGLAEEMGLARPEEPHRTIGFSSCTLPEWTIERHQGIVDRIEGALGLVRRDPAIMALLPPQGGEEDGQEDGDNAKDPLKGKALCQCGDEFAVRIPKKALRRGIICAVCTQMFVAHEEDED